MPRADKPHIELIDASTALLEAAPDAALFSELLGGAAIAEGWLDFPDALERMCALYRDGPSPKPWGVLFFVLNECVTDDLGAAPLPSRRTMIGWGGYKGAPSDDGEVEIGYAIAPGFRGRDLATLAAQTMIARAYETPRVTAILAHTLMEKNASVRILEKLGFVFAGEVEEPGHGEVWRWRLVRPEISLHS